MTERKDLAETRRSLPMSLLRTRELVMERFRPMLGAHGVTEQQWRVIRVLDERGTTDASSLSEGAALLPQSLTRILRGLDERGFVAVTRDPNDGRRQQISLTDAGAALVTAVAPESAGIYARLEAEIGARRIEKLLDDLEEICAALQPRAD
ncbi:homoprotocatechuate degradation operon regulator HpaR (plasmid) [Salipiger sp. H15]|uniref:Homoprotocatechuate degradation operon regulator HpaR n=1 Tax=Alloyangia sp. H15 TaxID=3029062 RepID=A0AAU8ARK4_9RHOB